MRFLLQILIFLVIPVVLLTLGIIPLDKRGIVLAAVFLGIIIVAIIEKIPLKTLGIRTDNFRKAFTPYSAFTLIGIFVLLGLGYFLNKEPLANWWTYSHLQWAFLPISVFQEFGYRAYFQTKLQKIINPYIAILVMSTLYSGMHILWKDPLIISMTFGAGLGWGYLWYKYPNLYLIILSHSILNFLAIYLGFFRKLTI